MSLTSRPTGNVQFVDLALTFGVLHLPHPLFCHDVNFGRVGGWRALFEVNDGAPGEDHHEDEERNRAPGNFQRGRAFDLFGANAGTMTEPGRKKDDQDENQQGHHPGDDEQKNVERIHVGRHRGSLLRP